MYEFPLPFTAVCFSDSHFRFWSGGSLKPVREVLDAIYEYVIERQPNLLLFGGDMYHSHEGGAYKLDVRLSSLVEEFFYSRIYPLGIWTVFALGNHDKVYKDKAFPNTLTSLSRHPKAVVLQNPNIYKLPTKLVLQSRDDDALPYPWIGLWHIDVLGKQLDSGVVSEAGEELDSVDAEMLLLGHYHNPSQQGNRLYLGSTNHDDYNDANTDKYIYYFEWDEEFRIVRKSMMDLDIPYWVKISSIEDIENYDCNNAYVRIDEEVPIEQQEAIRETIMDKGALSCNMKNKLTKQDVHTESYINWDTKASVKQNLSSAALKYLDSQGLPSELERTTAEKLLEEGLNEVL